MRNTYRIGLILVAALLAFAGLYYVVFGAVYDATYFAQAGFSNCGVGCVSSGYSSTSVIFSSYPIWSPPSWNHVNYSATICGPTASSYTPQNPPPSCLYPPAILSPDYSRNYGGVFLLVLATLTVVFVFVSKEKLALVPPKGNSEEKQMLSA